MKVLVTGGAGFIGSHTVDALLAEGHSVAVVDNLSSGRKALVPDSVAFYEMDIRDEALKDVFAAFKPTHVIHSAAQMDVRISVLQPRFDADVNVVGSLNVLQNCVDHDVKKFVFSSTGGAIYGEPEELPADEQCPARPLCQYGTAKYAFEQYIGLYQRLYQLPFTILRYGNVYGPRQNPHGEAGVCAILTQLMLAGKQPVLYGFGEPVRDYVYVGDVARANVMALSSADGEIMNICSGVGTTVRAIFDFIREETGFEGEPRLEPIRQGEVMRIFTSCEKAARVLNWTPQTELKDGLAATVAYIKDEK